MNFKTETKINLIKIAVIVWIVILGATAVLVTYDRFSNPTLTETQLFLKRWPVYSGVAVSLLVVPLAMFALETKPGSR